MGQWNRVERWGVGSVNRGDEVLAGWYGEWGEGLRSHVGVGIF